MKRILEAIWAGCELWPEYAGLLRQALTPPGEPDRPGDPSPTRWLKLPEICCQAAGGDPLLVGELTAAWVLFQVAAHLMDSVEDKDPPDTWWAKDGPALALSAASGLFFTASLALERLRAAPKLGPATAIVEDFYRSLLNMSAGQHRDLTNPDPELETYWQVAAAKSGGFFGLGCRCGARLAGADQLRTAAYGEFGERFGLLVQLFDDIDTLRSLQEPPEADERVDLSRSLALAYARSVLPAASRERLRELLGRLPGGSRAAGELWQLLEGCGAKLYLLAEIERHHQAALDALERAEPLPGPRAELAAMLEQLTAMP